jgi:DNA-binding transcriptional ArsR family regulator
MAKLPMTDKMLDLVARRFRTLGEPYRLRILQVLESGERSVGELVSELEGNQSNVSKHLQILFDGGLVERRRLGNTILYAISDPMVFSLCELVCRNTADRSRQELAELSTGAAKKIRR